MKLCYSAGVGGPGIYKERPEIYAICFFCKDENFQKFLKECRVEDYEQEISDRLPIVQNYFVDDDVIEKISYDIAKGDREVADKLENFFINWFWSFETKFVYAKNLGELNDKINEMPFDSNFYILMQEENEDSVVGKYLVFRTTGGCEAGFDIVDERDLDDDDELSIQIPEGRVLRQSNYQYLKRSMNEFYALVSYNSKTIVLEPVCECCDYKISKYGEIPEVEDLWKRALKGEDIYLPDQYNEVEKAIENKDKESFYSDILSYGTEVIKISKYIFGMWPDMCPLYGLYKITPFTSVADLIKAERFNLKPLYWGEEGAYEGVELLNTKVIEKQLLDFFTMEK